MGLEAPSNFRTPYLLCVILDAHMQLFHCHLSFTQMPMDTSVAPFGQVLRKSCMFTLMPLLSRVLSWDNTPLILALPSQLLVSVGPSPTLDHLGPLTNSSTNPWCHLGPPCAHGVLSTPYGEVHNTNPYFASWFWSIDPNICFILWFGSMSSNSYCTYCSWCFSKEITISNLIRFFWPCVGFQVPFDYVFFN
jgi:hypothetical protein